MARKKFQSTPWGPADSVRKVAPGIYEIGTPSHGGYYVDDERYAKMPDKFKRCSFTNNQFFEEDCSWAGVVLSFPEIFDAKHVAEAQRMYDRFYKAREGLAR